VWPLLQLGQDPEGVPARVAFHLHSFGLRSTGLANVLGISARYATDYLQGRVDLTEQQAIQFARLLQVNPAELIRPLTPEEAAEWRFYRISASHHVAVWQRARATWQHQGYSLSAAARLMGFTPAYVCLALQPDGRRRTRCHGLPPYAWPMPVASRRDRKPSSPSSKIRTQISAKPSMRHHRQNQGVGIINHNL
jgi:hypothetical protein